MLLTKPLCYLLGAEDELHDEVHDDVVFKRVSLDARERQATPPASSALVMRSEDLYADVCWRMLTYVDIC